MPFKDKATRNAYNRKYRQRNGSARWSTFGIKPDDLTEMLEKQDHKCAICEEGPLLPTGQTALSSNVDHCHACKKVRSLLCKRCNLLLGFIESDFDKFQKALLYHVDHAEDCI